MSNDQRPTPRTDAEVARIKAVLDQACTSGEWEAPVVAVGVDFARTLELELIEWQMLRSWGGTPAHVEAFIKGQQDRIHATQDVERELAEANAENTRLRAALANSPGACVYCQLPKEQWATCRSGFPGCARADDAMGCPELGASMQLEAAHERIRRLEEAFAAAEGLIASERCDCKDGDEVMACRRCVEAITRYHKAKEAKP